MKMKKSEIKSRRECISTLGGILIAGIILGIVLAWIAGANSETLLNLSYGALKDRDFNWKLFFFVLTATVAPFIGIYFSGMAVVDYVMSMSNQTIGAFENIDQGKPAEEVTEPKKESSKTKCPYCGASNDKGAKKCINCKEPLETES